MLCVLFFIIIKKGYNGVLVRNIFHTDVTKSITYVAMTSGNQRSNDNDVIINSLLST